MSLRRSCSKITKNILGRGLTEQPYGGPGDSKGDTLYQKKGTAKGIPFATKGDGDDKPSPSLSPFCGKGDIPAAAPFRGKGDTMEIVKLFRGEV